MSFANVNNRVLTPDDFKGHFDKFITWIAYIVLSDSRHWHYSAECRRSLLYPKTESNVYITIAPSFINSTITSRIPFIIA